MGAGGKGQPLMPSLETHHLIGIKVFLILRGWFFRIRGGGVRSNAKNAGSAGLNIDVSARGGGEEEPHEIDLGQGEGPIAGKVLAQKKPEKGRYNFRG